MHLPDKSLVVYVGVPLAIAQGISIASAPHIVGWYNRMNKPKWTPPKWLFGPAWGVMYAAQSYSGWRVLHQGGRGGRAAALWGTQLALNFAWQPLFFNAHKLKIALLDILALDVTIALTALEFRKTDRTAALLLVPYLAWCTYATALNYNIMVNNSPQGSPEERRQAARVNKKAMMDRAQKVPGVSRDQADQATGQPA
jgi:tryptophan-rich sensory protein